jgi:RNA polymerase sigma-70 factor (ECF subfamily)
MTIGWLPEAEIGGLGRDLGDGSGTPGDFTDARVVRRTDFGKSAAGLGFPQSNKTMNATLIADHEMLAEDLSLVEGLVRHDPEAMETLCRRYGTVMKAIIMKVLHDEAEAEDVLQDVFMQVWDRAEHYSPERGKLLSWLSTVARRRAIDRVRQTCAYRRATDRFEVVSRHPDKDIDQTHPVEYQAQQSDVRQLIDRQLDLLPDNQREAICLAYLEGRSQREIASITHTPLGTVKTRIELGLRKLSLAIGGSKDKIL